MALHIRRPSPSIIKNLRRLSSSSDGEPGYSQPPSSHESATGPPSSPSTSPSVSSYFNDVKERLKSAPSPPRRIPHNPPLPPPISPAAQPIHFDDIRSRLSEYKRPSSSSTRPSSPPPISFQEILKKNIINNSEGSQSASNQSSYDAISASLRNFQATTGGISRPNPLERMGLSRWTSQASIFGKKANEGTYDAELAKSSSRKFVKMYDYDELGERLRQLRPEKGAMQGDRWFSLRELNERLAKLQEIEDKRSEEMSGIALRDLRESLNNLMGDKEQKKNNMSQMSILMNFGQTTPEYLSLPPKEHLLEKYFHSDHMSASEKLELELQKVRDEFKMSESDCGSARLQIAQLTTKIKHLSSVLHKKDKHSRKGLQEMVQRRKKHLKYLRRTDWDSYCLVLSKFGLRDVPEYKTPDYKKDDKKEAKREAKRKLKQMSKKKKGMSVFPKRKAALQT